MMMTVHGEELVETLSLTTMLQTHHSDVINDHIGIRLEIHVFDALGHDAVMLKGFEVWKTILIGRRVGDDHHTLGFHAFQEFDEKVGFTHVALSQKQYVLSPGFQSRNDFREPILRLELKTRNVQLVSSSDRGWNIVIPYGTSLFLPLGFLSKERDKVHDQMLKDGPM